MILRLIKTLAGALVITIVLLFSSLIAILGYGLITSSGDMFRWFMSNWIYFAIPPGILAVVILFLTASYYLGDLLYTESRA